MSKTRKRSTKVATSNKSVIVARRTFFEADNKKIKYKLEIFAPKKAANGSYNTSVKFRGAPDHLRSADVGGNDSMQSLLLAIEVARTHIELLNEHLDLKLRYFDDETDLRMRP